MSMKIEKKIHIMTKISLLKEVLPNIKDIITSSQYKEYDTLITSCSFSKNKTVFNQLRNYTNKLSTSLNIQNKIFHMICRNAFGKLSSISKVSRVEFPHEGACSIASRTN